MKAKFDRELAENRIEAYGNQLLNKNLSAASRTSIKRGRSQAIRRLREYHENDGKCFTPAKRISNRLAQIAKLEAELATMRTEYAQKLANLAARAADKPS